MLKKPPTHSMRAQDGFAMVVIALLFVAFAVIAAVLVERNTALQYIVRRDQAAQQLSRLANAIIEYGVTNQSASVLLYPCPAPENVLASNAAFGVAVSNCSSTAGDVAGPPATTSTGIAIMGTDVLRGMVPVQALAPYAIGLNDAFDPWNNRIEYVVNRRFTVGSTTTSGAAASNPTVNYPYNALIIPKPDFILISYGRDGVGATRRDATSVAIACPTSTTLLRQINCSVTKNFVAPPTYTASSATSANYFDDIVTFYTQ